MELKWLEDFTALAQERHFSRAAEARSVTQPAFSRRIRTLEDWLGAKLFVRSPQRVELTPAGEELLRGADDLIRRIAQLRREVREASGREMAVLLFAATHALSFTFFPGWVRAVEQGSSTGPLRLVSDSMMACEDLMLHGQAQFLLCHHHALAPGRCSGADFRSVVVGHDALVPYVALGADGAPLWQLAEGTGDIPMLAYGAESGLGRIVAAHRFEARARGLRIVFSAQLAAALLGMARDGRGVAWLPATLATAEVQAGLLVRAGDARWDVPIEIRVFRPSEAQSPAAEAFWDRLVGQ